jgi:hypothetical protein
MIRKKRSTSDITVPQNVYQHLQAGFAESNAQRCVEYEDNRIFLPGGCVHRRVQVAVGRD